MSKETFSNNLYDKAKWLLLIIPLLYVVLTMGLPLLDIIKKSLISKQGFTFGFYIKAFTEPLYLSVLFSTVKIAFIVTLVCLVLAYPMAYLSVNAKTKKSKSVNYCRCTDPLLGINACTYLCLANHFAKQRYCKSSFIVHRLCKRAS